MKIFFFNKTFSVFLNKFRDPARECEYIYPMRYREFIVLQLKLKFVREV